MVLLRGLQAADVPAPASQIASAVLAAPEDLRDGAAVLGYNAQGALVQLRKGKNEMICLASDPSKPSFSAACYHRDLEPYMARGRELLAQKVTAKQRNDIRWKEVADGKLALPREPRTRLPGRSRSYSESTAGTRCPRRHDASGLARNRRGRRQPQRSSQGLRDSRHRCGFVRGSGSSRMA